MNLLLTQEVLEPVSEDPLELTNETVRWRARDATFLAGKWDALSKRIPRFVLEDFKATADGPANPHIRAVVRVPVSVTEQRIPVGVVSNTYGLTQHADVVEMCLKGIRAHDIDPSMLRCEVGLTPLGEWMNFRAYFPDSFSHKPGDGNKLALRLECFNSVDGSSRLLILFGWFRFVCANGLVIGETKAALRDIHDENLNLDVIPKIISEGLEKVKADLDRLVQWERSPIELAKFEGWVDEHLAERWGKKAACRTLHVCRIGADVELLDLFAGGKPSEKPVKLLNTVPGAAKPAKNLYDVCQALSWIAMQRNSADERLEWQGHIPGLIENLWSHLEAA
ncbi:DUF932 domain-containing protein [Candidatus Accumulibacter sp. ACC005]|uniref:DUF932 domain-containing protein n=1 Tax=Candidatus Accumulibacter sp. ACC005 TaxID=2823331 RepID=UPI0025BB6EB3|nr:DUF932 domain-containing protein [Candidatus Accumulibacter sp. ACC005]